MTITPSPQQAAAIRAIVDWYRNPHRQQPVFRLFGYAGSGNFGWRLMSFERAAGKVGRSLPA